MTPKKIRDVLSKSYKTTRIPTGETVAGCKIVEEISEFDEDQALLQIKQAVLEGMGSFEDYLMDKHAEQYIGTKDCMVDDCADWIANLSADEFIEYANEFMRKRIEELCTQKLAQKNMEG